MEQQLSLNFNLPKPLVDILNKIILNGGTPILVGGIVRDYFLEKESKDYDIEVYGFDTIEELLSILKEFGEVNIVGVSFGILKLTVDNYDIDFSFPRLENKSGLGHRGFEIKIDGNLTFEDAAKRRDFTINSIGYDFKNKKFLDPFNGVEDIKKRVLKHIDDSTFEEDPLRVYRAVQFCGRFNFDVDNATKILCKKMIKSIDFETLSKHRIFQEYKKLLLKSMKPSIGLK
ncbi:MAG: CCA tRNA nucleotidyltransferase, partial [Campylobacterota bacterium]|nr:CCA tRNA nucleotidyltransferase [Campylobacterota bacterium]